MPDFFDDALSVLGQLAPGIATAIGGPLAGMAVQALTGALGMGEGASKEDVLRAVAGASPEQLAAIKKADQDFAVRMKELDIDIYALDQADRASARDREAKVGGLANPVLATFVMAGFFGVSAAVIFGNAGADPATSTIVGAIIGYASAKADQVVSYYFGSSAGSKRKTEAMASQIGTSKNR